MTWDPAQHPRHPAHAPAGKGGEFRDAGAGDWAQRLFEQHLRRGGKPPWEDPSIVYRSFDEQLSEEIVDAYYPQWRDEVVRQTAEMGYDVDRLYEAFKSASPHAPSTLQTAYKFGSFPHSWPLPQGASGVGFQVEPRYFAASLAGLGDSMPPKQRQDVLSARGVAAGLRSGDWNDTRQALPLHGWDLIEHPDFGENNDFNIEDPDDPYEWLSIEEVTPDYENRTAEIWASGRDGDKTWVIEEDDEVTLLATWRREMKVGLGWR